MLYCVILCYIILHYIILYYIILLLYYYIIILLYYCIIILLYYYIIVLLYCYITILLYYYIILLYCIVLFFVLYSIVLYYIYVYNQQYGVNLGLSISWPWKNRGTAMVDHQIWAPFSEFQPFYYRDESPKVVMLTDRRGFRSSLLLTWKSPKFPGTGRCTHSGNRPSPHWGMGRSGFWQSFSYFKMISHSGFVYAFEKWFLGFGGEYGVSSWSFVVWEDTGSHATRSAASANWVANLGSQGPGFWSAKDFDIQNQSGRRTGDLHHWKWQQHINHTLVKSLFWLVISSILAGAMVKPLFFIVNSLRLMVESLCLKLKSLSLMLKSC